MSLVRHRRSEVPVLLQWRRFGFGHNPLRRRADRLESAALVSALLAAVLAIPAAAILGSTVRDQAEQSAAVQRAGLYQVQARTLQNTADVVPTAPGQIVSQVRVAWYDALGLPREGQTEVLMGTKAGAVLTIWLDRSGAIRSAPKDAGDTAALATGAALTLLLVAWPSSWGLYRLARRSLDRRRDQAWTREWEQIAPRWTRNTDHRGDQK